MYVSVMSSVIVGVYSRLFDMFAFIFHRGHQSRLRPSSVHQLHIVLPSLCSLALPV